MQKEVTILCSGYAACVAAGQDSAEALQGCELDFDRAGKIIDGWKLKNFPEQCADAIHLMQQPENMRAVHLLADELEQHHVLVSEEIDLLIDVADELLPMSAVERFRLLSGGRHKP